MPGPTRPTPPSDPTVVDGPRPSVDGPPPPPAGSGSEAEARATAAAWVAAVGAVLLLAAAGTFLAVSWDGLGLTARVAVVAGVTGAAILGGQRLRRVLPAVGAVVFHLGALLVPVDALGLAYQLGAGQAVRWAAVGFTAATVLPALAAVGRSRVLGPIGLAGLPVVATAAGIAGLAYPAAVLGVLAVLALAVEPSHVDEAADGPLVATRRLAAPGLATLAVMVPLVLALADRSAGSGTVLGAAATGWVSSSWVVTAAVGSAAVGVLALTATRRHHAGIAGLALASAVVSVVLTVLPPATPRAVLLLAPAFVWLLAEVAALGGRDHRLWAVPTRTVAIGLEVLALTGFSSALAVLLPVAGRYGVDTDPALAAQSITLAGAWSVAAVRRSSPGAPGGGGTAVVLGLAVAVHLAAAALQLGGGAEFAGVLLLLAAVATLGVLSDADERFAQLTGPAARRVAPFAALVLLGLSGIVVVDRAVASAVLVTLPLVVGTHLAAALRTGPARPAWVVPVAAALTTSVTLLGWLASVVEVAGHLPSGVASLMGVMGLLGLASAVERLEPAADSLRALAVIAGLVLLVPTWDAGGIAAGAGRSGLFWAYGLRVIPAAAAPSIVVGGWLVFEAVRRRRTAIAALAAPVVVRALAAGSLAAGVPLRLTGALLLVVGVAGACVAAIGPSRLAGPLTVGSSVAGVVGWVFVADTPTLRAALVVAAGLGIVAVGASRRRPLTAHLGGVVATVGIWQLLGIGQVTALDLWLLPVAVQLAVAGALAHRRGTSSWVGLVPPLLLVAIPAVAERVTGGPGWHAVLAGGVGVLAIVAGGARRLGGPLIVGTVVTVTVVLAESFTVVAAVPTWVWLTVGGSSLLGAAALIERAGGSPARAVRRMVDVVGERFD